MQRFRNQILIWSPDPDCDQSKLSSIEQWLHFFTVVSQKAQSWLRAFLWSPSYFTQIFTLLKTDWKLTETHPPPIPFPYSPLTVAWPNYRGRRICQSAFGGRPIITGKWAAGRKKLISSGGSRMLKKGSKGGGQNVENKLIKIGGSKKLNMGSTKKGKLCRKWNVC